MKKTLSRISFLVAWMVAVRAPAGEIHDAAKAGDLANYGKAPQLAASLQRPEKERFTDFKGGYLGQTPPSRTPAIFAPGIVSTIYMEHSAPTFSPDGNEVFWHVAKGFVSAPGVTISPRTMKCINGRWAMPTDSPYGGALSFSPDGRRLYFSHLPPGNRADGPYFVERRDSGWSEPHTLGLVARFPELKAVHSPTVTRGRTLYFSADTVGQGRTKDHRIYRAKFRDGDYSKPELLPRQINLPETWNYAPFIAPDESYLLFSSNRPGSLDDHGDLYVSFHDIEADIWSEPVSLGEPINTRGQESNPAVSPDGKYLFFTGPSTSNQADVYWVSASVIAEARTKARRTGMRLQWTYFIGGSRADGLGWLHAPVLNRDGMLWFTGTTKSPDFPTTPDAFDRTFHGGGRWGAEDVVLIAFDTRRPAVAYSTLLGGAGGPEHAAALHVDGTGRVMIAGNTGSRDFPTTSEALTREFRGPDFRHADGFLTLLSDGGRKLKYSTFVGAGKNDGVDHVFVEPSGEITLFGGTESAGFPADTIRPTDVRDGPALFVMRLDATGQRVLFARVLANSWGSDVQRLDSGDFLITGSTDIPDFASAAGVSWPRDVFVLRLTADLQMASPIARIGGSGAESWPRVAVAPNGDIFVCGKTKSQDLPVTANAIEKTMEAKDALFLARFSDNGRRLVYCTYLGGKGTESTSSIGSLVCDGRSRLYIAGATTSLDLPVTPDAAQPALAGGQDGFILTFNLADNSLVYGSYLGGSGMDGELRLTLDRAGSLYVLGQTDSADFPTSNQAPSPRKGTDIFIAKFAL